MGWLQPAAPFDASGTLTLDLATPASPDIEDGVVLFSGRSVYGSNGAAHDFFSLPSSGPAYTLWYDETFGVWLVSQALGVVPGGTPVWGSNALSGDYVTQGAPAVGSFTIAGLTGT